MIISLFFSAIDRLQPVHFPSWREAGAGDVGQMVSKGGSVRGFLDWCGAVIEM